MPDSTTDPAATPESLAALLIELNAKITPLVANYLDVESQLLKLAPEGELQIGDLKLNIVAARAGSAGSTSISFDLKPEDEAKVRELAGEHFSKLFDRVVKHVPIEGFAPVVSKFLITKKGEPTKDARELLDLCRVETKYKCSSGASAHIKGIDRNWTKKK